MAGAAETTQGIYGAGAPEADLRAIGRSLWAKKALIIGPTLLAAAAASFISSSLTPLYRSEARVLVESNATVYTRPEGTTVGEQREADELAVQSQVQLLLSRDLARQVADELNLAATEEFNPSGGTMSSVKRVLSLIGLARDTAALNTDDRVLQNYYEHLSVYAVPTSRVIVAEFSSADPELAAKVANAVTSRYLDMQQTAKQSTTRRASGWLASQIEEMSGRVAESEARVEEFRSKSNLFLGTNNSTITNQQLGELNTELSRARAQQADAQAKANLIKQTLKAGQPIESLDLANSELIRALSTQRVELAAAIAREARTYMPGHPRMKELQAQIDSLDLQIKGEAAKLARAYENEANVAAGRVASVQNTIEAQKEVAGSASEQEVQLRALEREAKAQRDILEQFLARYRDAMARERVDAIPADARIISTATPTNTPYFPKPIAITVLTALSVFLLLVIGITASEFMVVSTPAAAPVRGVTVEPDAGEAVPAPNTVPAPPPPVPNRVAAMLSAASREPEIAPVPEAEAVMVMPQEESPVVVPEPELSEPEAALETPSAQAEPSISEAVMPADEEAPAAISEATPPAMPVSEAAAAAQPVPVFGRINSAAPGAPQAEQMNIEAADMRMLGDLATHLASMPRGDGALNILTLAATAAIDAGHVALQLARSLAAAGRKAIVVDAGSGSRELAAAIPNPGEGGLGELIAGNTSFGQAIQRDRASSAHLIGAGGAGLLNARSFERIGVVFDALGLTYDFVVVLSPSAERNAEMATLARRTGAAILVSNIQDRSTVAAHNALTGAGIGDVVLLLTGTPPQVNMPVERAS